MRSEIITKTCPCNTHIGKNIFELKSTISSLLNFSTNTETSTPVTNVKHNEFKRYPEFNKKQIMGTENIHRLQHDFWKGTTNAKQKLLVCFHLHYNKPSKSRHFNV